MGKAPRLLAKPQETQTQKTPEYRILGRTGIKVSAVGYGASRTLEPSLVKGALETGINFFDTAEGYNNGVSEQIVGKALADRRDKAVIASKISPNHTAPAELRGYCEAALKRMQIDYVDVYMIHWPIRTHSVAGTFEVLQQLKDEGVPYKKGVYTFRSNGRAMALDRTDGG